MSVFRLDENGDLYRPATASSFERVSGAQQSFQHMRTRLRLFTGEVFRDTRIGVDLELVMNPGISPNTIANHIASIALGTPGVADCQLSFEREPIREVVTVYGEATFDEIDLVTRQPLHESFQITVGGSIQ